MKFLYERDPFDANSNVFSVLFKTGIFYLIIILLIILIVLYLLYTSNNDIAKKFRNAVNSENQNLLGPYDVNDDDGNEETWYGGDQNNERYEQLTTSMPNFPDKNMGPDLDVNLLEKIRLFGKEDKSLKIKNNYQKIHEQSSNLILKVQPARQYLTFRVSRLMTKNKSNEDNKIYLYNTYRKCIGILTFTDSGLHISTRSKFFADHTRNIQSHEKLIVFTQRGTHLFIGDGTVRIGEFEYDDMIQYIVIETKAIKEILFVNNSAELS